MCINVLRPRPRPFIFGWVSISLCYAKISVFCPTSSSPLSFHERDFIMLMSVMFCMMEALFEVTTQSRKRFRTATYESDQYLLYVFMYSWVYNGVRQPCFSRCMVKCTLMTDQMTTIFVFHFIWGHVPVGWICYQYSSREGPLVILMKITPNIKTGTS